MFENWAVIALGGIPNKTQVGDMGIDGRIFPVSALENRRKNNDYADGALSEIGRFFKQTGRVIVPLTVRDILDEQIAHKLA